MRKEAVVTTYDVLCRHSSEEIQRKHETFQQVWPISFHGRPSSTWKAAHRLRVANTVTNVRVRQKAES
jgi:hypothetical protein